MDHNKYGINMCFTLPQMNFPDNFGGFPLAAYARKPPEINRKMGTANIPKN
jgi:hypothetical protein